MNSDANQAVQSVIAGFPFGVAVLDRNLARVCASGRWADEFENPDLLASDALTSRFARALEGDVIQVDEERISCADGGARWIEFTVSPWRDGTGEIVGVVVVARDITGRKRMETALNERKAFLRQIVNSNPVAIVTSDIRGTILTFNRMAETTFGYSGEEAIGQNVKILMRPQEAREHDGYLRRYVDGGDAKIIGSSMAITARRKNGDTFPARLHLTEFQDGASVFVAFIQDLTEEVAARKRVRETQEQLQHAARLGALGEMATTIAHEINQPLTAAASLAGAAALILRKGSAAKAADAIDLIEDTVNELKRAGEIIYQMRDFARTHKSAPSLSDVNKVVDDAASIALIGAESDGIVVEFDFDAGLGAARFDRIQLQQVIVNLIRNAIEAMKHSSPKKIRIATKKSGEHFEISIADSGPGVSAEMRPRLFEPFATDKDSGLGVGLSISKSIIDAHQGEIAVLNDQSGGAVFTVRLPIEG